MTQQLLDKIASLKDALRREQERRIIAEGGNPSNSQLDGPKREVKQSEIEQYKKRLNRGNNKR